MRVGIARGGCGTSLGQWAVSLDARVTLNEILNTAHRDMELDVVGLLETDLHVSNLDIDTNSHC